MKAYLNGNIVEYSDIKISPKDLGFSRAYAAYEALTAVGTNIFMFDEHFDRLLETLEYTMLDCPWTKSELLEIIQNLITINGLSTERVSIKLYITGGESPDGFKKISNNQTYFIYIEQAHSFGEKSYTEGVKLVTAQQQYNGKPHKTNNYLTTLRLQNKLNQEEGFELLWISESGLVLECATSAIACVIDSEVYFPTVKDAILSSITVLATKKLLKDNNIIYHEVPITFEDFLKADEVFSLSSFKDIVPVRQINSTIIGDGKPGKTTLEIMKFFREALFSSAQ